METKRLLQFDHPLFAICNAALRTERLVCGLLSLGLAAGLAAVSAVAFSGEPLYLAAGLAAAAVLAALAVWQIALFPVLKKYPYSLVVTEEALIVREKNRYHYIRYEDLGKLKINCRGFSEEYTGPGRERLDFIDGEIYYYIGDMKKRFATREAERTARLVFGCVVSVPDRPASDTTTPDGGV